MSGQNAYTPSALLLQDLILIDGVTQQISINSVDDVTIRRVITSATKAPDFPGHGCDFDAVANEKPTKNLLIEDCDLDAYQQECIKFENTTNATVRRTILRMYVSLVQDQVDVYASLDNIVFDQCTIMAAVIQSFNKRRRIPGSSYTNIFPTNKTCTLSGTNSIGGIVTSPGSAGGAGEYVFVAGDVGQMIGYYSGQGTGAAQITAVNGSGGITATVVDVFSILTLPSWNGTGPAKWVVAGTDNAASAAITFKRCTFTSSGVIWGQSPASNNYGTQTLTDNTFSPAGNSWTYPSGVTVVKSGNLYAELPLKRFARPTVNPKYGTSLGGLGIVGINQGAARENAITNIVEAVGYSVSGDEVWALNGVYTASGATNRNINCGGKLITLRAESMFGVLINGSTGGSAQCFSSSTDPLGSVIWGFVAANWSGGSGAGFAVTGGNVRLAHVRAVNCTASNGGGGFRVSAGSPIIEDYDAESCTASGAGGGGIYNASATAIFKRGRLRSCTATGNIGGGLRNLTASGAIYDTLEISGCLAGTAGGGIAASAGCTINNLTAIGNTATSTGGHDLWIANGQTVTIDSSIIYSADGGGLFPINNGTTGNLKLSNSTLQGGASVGRIGNSGGTNSWTGITTENPQLADSVNGNLRPLPSSPARDTGTTRMGEWDRFGYAFVGAVQGALYPMTDL